MSCRDAVQINSQKVQHRIIYGKEGKEKKDKQRGETEGGALREGATSACIVPGTLSN